MEKYSNTALYRKIEEFWLRKGHVPHSKAFI